MRRRNHRSIAIRTLGPLTLIALLAGGSAQGEGPSREETAAALKKASAYFRGQVAVRGGYVYYYSLDLKRRLGEGAAAPDQIWVQPPGTPTVGVSYLTAYQATKDSEYLDAARETAAALRHGQLKSGGWTNSISFDPEAPESAFYRNRNVESKAKPRGRKYSTLDDGISQSALLFLMRLDQTLDFKDAKVHESAKIALDALLAAQYPNGGFPQVWDGPSPSRPVAQASYPDYEWRTENRVKEYWHHYTLNDGLCGDVADVLIEAHAVYNDPRCRKALAKLGDFLILAQLPDPQPAWSQQYNVAMRPVWARKFEPPAVTGSESQDAIEALIKVFEQTRDPKYLGPIPRALTYLRSSLLDDGRLARFYELKTNKPLFMTKQYELTYDDSNVPTHYGWKVSAKLDSLEKKYDQAKRAAESPKLKSSKPKRLSVSERAKLAKRAEEAIRALDDQGRWITVWTGGLATGQPKFAKGERILSSEVFSRNLEALSAYLKDGF